MLSIKVEAVFAINGHIQQKYSKMIADKYLKSPFIFHLDSDVVVHKKWNPSCYSHHGRIVNEYASFTKLPSSVIQWKTGMQKMLSIKNVEYEFSRKNQHVYPRSIYRKLRKHLERIHEMPFKGMFYRDGLKLVGRGHDLRNEKGSILISDFNLLGAFAYYFDPVLMKSVDVSDGHFLPFCTSQCNLRMCGLDCIAWMKEQMDSEKPHLRWKNCEPYLKTLFGYDED